MSTNIHIYTAAHEPAIRFNIAGPTGGTSWMGYKPHELLVPECCGYPKRRQRKGKRFTVPGKHRWAQNCVVQVYYDCIRIWCAKGKGCRKSAD